MENNQNQTMSGFGGNIATLKESVAVFKKYWKEFLVAFAAFILINVIAQAADMFMQRWYGSSSGLLFYFIITIALLVIMYIIYVGFFKIIIDGVANTKPNVRDLYLQYRRVPSFVFSSTVASIISLIGLFMLVFGIFPLTARYQFCYLFVIDKKVGMAESLHLSDVATRGSLWKIIKLDIFLSLINLVWVILAVILFAMGLGAISAVPLLGLIVTAPLSIVAYVVAYKKFSDSPAQNVKEQNGKMVAIIVALFALLVVIMIFIGGAIAAMVASNPAFQKAFESTNELQTSPFMPTESTPSATGEVDSDDAFAESFRTSFVDSCSQSGGTAASCTCMADYIIDNYSQSQLMSLGQSGASSEIAEGLTEAATKCASE